VPLHASAEPGRAEASADGNGVPLPWGDGDPSDPALGPADAVSVPLGEAAGSADACDAAGDPLAGGCDVWVAPHAATSTAMPSIATSRVARPGRGRVMGTPGA
jgi:hypothetical protein